jgi:hypothetical protein
MIKFKIIFFEGFKNENIRLPKPSKNNSCGKKSKGGVICLKITYLG